MASPRYPPGQQAIGDLYFSQRPVIRTDMTLYTIYDKVCFKAGVGYSSFCMHDLTTAAVSFPCPAPESSVRGNVHLQRKCPQSIFNFSLLYGDGYVPVRAAYRLRAIGHCCLPAI
jgi:hypothetical protein